MRFFRLKTNHPANFAGVILTLIGLAFLSVFLISLMLSQQVVPVVIQANEGNASVTLVSDNARMLLETGCFDVRWSTENIQAVHFNNAPTVGLGEATVCGQDAALGITFQDGESSEYRLSPDITLGTGLLWQLPLLAAVFVSTGIIKLRRRSMPAVFSRATFQAQTDSRYLWAVVAFILLGMGVRIHFLETPIRGDEAWTFVDFTSRPLLEAISTYTSTNNHLLHTLLQHISYQVFGKDIIWLRLPTLIAGLLAIAVAYRAGTDVYGRWTGLMTAASMALLSSMVEMSVNARAYSLWYFLLLLMIVLGRRAMQQNRPRYWTALAVVIALSFYATPLTLYSTGAVLLWILLNLLSLYQGQALWQRMKAFVFAGVMAGVLTFALYVPVLMWFLAGQQESAVFETVAPTSGLATYAANFTDNLRQTLENLTEDAEPIALLLQIGAIVALLIHRRLSREPISLVLTVALWLVPVLYATRAVFVSRAFLFLIPIFALTSFAGLSLLIQKIPPGTGRTFLRIGIACLSSIVFLVSAWQSDWPDDSYDVVPGGYNAATYLVDQWGTYDAALMRHPVYNVIRFHLPRMNTDLAAQIVSLLRVSTLGPDSPNDVLVVVNQASEDVNIVMGRGKFDPELYDGPVYQAGLPAIEIWLLQQRQEAQ